MMDADGIFTVADELRNVFLHGTRETDESVLDEHHQGRRGDRLRDRHHREDRVALEWRAAMGTEPAEGFVQTDDAAARDKDTKRLVDVLLDPASAETLDAPYCVG
jgi:hypothetical protein